MLLFFYIIIIIRAFAYWGQFYNNWHTLLSENHVSLNNHSTIKYKNFIKNIPVESVLIALPH